MNRSERSAIAGGGRPSKYKLEYAGIVKKMCQLGANRAEPSRLIIRNRLIEAELVV